MERGNYHTDSSASNSSDVSEDGATEAISSRKNGQTSASQSGRKARRRRPVTPVSDESTANRPSRSRSKKSKGLPKERLFLENAANDAWGILQMVFRQVRMSSPPWEWLLLVWLAWLAISYLMIIFLSSKTSPTIKPICSIPIIGPQFSICTVFNESSVKAIGWSKVPDTIHELTTIMGHTAPSLELGATIADQVYPVRDLGIRVATSALPCAPELAEELRILSRNIIETSKGLPCYACLTGGTDTIGAIAIFDDIAVIALQKIHRRIRRATLLGRVLSMIDPFNAIGLITDEQNKLEVKQVIMYTVTQINEEVKMLLDDVIKQAQQLNNTMLRLDRIKQSCYQKVGVLTKLGVLPKRGALPQIGDLPEMEVLRAFWAGPAEPDGSNQFESPTVLLQKVTRLYSSASNIVEESIRELRRVKADLDVFQGELVFSEPDTDIPLDVIIKNAEKGCSRYRSSETSFKFLRVQC